ncbi:hypothetical protein OAQ37_02270 [Alphaproteobacteria bacterium]|nr:hypothetical protein [Alphaproteobacteria bacterium]
MFSKLKCLIVTTLTILISSYSPIYASQKKIQIGDFSISFTGGNFDAAKLKGNITGVSIWSRRTKIGSASSASIHHSFSDKAFSEKFIEGQLTLSFEGLNLKFKDGPTELNEFDINIAEAYINASVDSNRLHVKNITLQGTKVDWLNKGFGVSLEKYSASDVVVGLGRLSPLTSETAKYLGADIGKNQLDNLKVTISKRHQPKAEVLSVENWTMSNCFGYSFLIDVVPDHFCSTSVSNASLSNGAITQLYPELSQALSENGIKVAKLNFTAEQSYKNVEEGYMIKVRTKSKVDGLVSIEGQSSTTMNETFWADMAANEKKWTSSSGEDIRKKAMAIMLGFDKTFIHSWKFTINDDGFINVAESFIKNQFPAFRRMSRKQLALEIKKGISGVLEEQANIANLINPFVERFMNGTGKINLNIDPVGKISVYERAKLVSDFGDFISIFNVRLSN